MELINYVLLIGIVMLGGLLSRLSGIDRGKKYLDASLVFSASFLLGIVSIHMIPFVGQSDNHFIGLWILFGFIIQLFLERFTQGIEHGHLHVHNNSRNHALQILIGLGIHAILEGIPLTFYNDIIDTHHHHQLGGDFNHLFWGVIVHKLPAAFTLGLLFVHAGYKGIKYYGIILIFALCTPFGALLAQFVELTSSMRISLIALVIGSMLHISTTIIFESDKQNHHKLSWQKMLAVILGMGLAVLSTL